MKYHPNHPYLSASTDGYIEQESGLELAEIKLIISDDMTSLATKLVEHTPQIQLTMQVHNLPRCHFIVYDLRNDAGKEMQMDATRLHSRIVERDDAWFESFLMNAALCNKTYLKWFHQKQFDKNSATNILQRLFVRGS
jgi:hypothetical protein